MADPSPHTFGLLGMLAVRPWTSYELTNQARRSLRFMWHSSEGHLYREQVRLVKLGWASVKEEQVGRRTRKRYSITAKGRKALSAWLSTTPQEPSFQLEGVVRTFFADQGSPEQLEATMRSTAADARSMLEELAGFAAEYLEEGGPMSMLESGQSGPGQTRQDFHGRPMFPERLPVVALSVDVVTQLLGLLEDYFLEAADDVSTWTSTTDQALAPRTRARLEAITRRRRSTQD